MLQHTVTDIDTTITVKGAPPLTGLLANRDRVATVQPVQVVIREWAQDEIVTADVSGPQLKRNGRLSRRWITVEVTLESPEVPSAPAPDWVHTLANRVRA